MLINTDGVVLRTVKVGNGDKMLTVLTRDNGKISCIARGACSLKSKKLACTQNFAYSHMSLSKKGDRLSLEQCELIEDFYSIGSDIEKTAVAGYMAQVCEYVTDESLGGEELTSLLLNCLYVLSKDGTDIKKVKAVFELRTMTAIGHMPDLEACHVCGAETGEMLFSPQGGVISCAGHGGGGLRVSPAALNAMRYICACADRRIFSFTVSAECLAELAALCERYTLAQLDHRFSTLDFYRTLTAGAPSV